MMKKSVKIALIAAAALICAGLILGVIAFALGARLDRGMEIAFGPTSVASSAPAGISWNKEFQTDGVYRITEPVQSMDLGWTAGQVEILIGDGDEIRLEECSSREITEKYALRCGVKDNTLYVRYTEPGKVLENVPVKDLTVTIPQSIAENMQELRMDGASAAWKLSSITAEKLEFGSTSGGLCAGEMRVRDADLDAVSGDIELSGSITGEVRAGTTSGVIQIENSASAQKARLSTTSGTMRLYGAFDEVSFSSTSGDIYAEGTADTVDADAISGTVTMTGSYRDIHVDTTSGNVSLDLRDAAPELDVGTISASVEIRSEVAPAKIDVDTTSGDVELAIPGGSSFTLDFDTISGDLKSDLPLTMKGSDLYSGDGSAEYSISTTSGSLKIQPLTTEKE